MRMTASWFEAFDFRYRTFEIGHGRDEAIRLQRWIIVDLLQLDAPHPLTWRYALVRGGKTKDNYWLTVGNGVIDQSIRSTARWSIASVRERLGEAAMTYPISSR